MGISIFLNIFYLIKHAKVVLGWICQTYFCDMTHRMLCNVNSKFLNNKHRSYSHNPGLGICHWLISVHHTMLSLETTSGRLTAVWKAVSKGFYSDLCLMYRIYGGVWFKDYLAAISRTNTCMLTNKKCVEMWSILRFFTNCTVIILLYEASLLTVGFSWPCGN